MFTDNAKSKTETKNILFDIKYASKILYEMQNINKRTPFCIIILLTLQFTIPTFVIYSSTVSKTFLYTKGHKNALSIFNDYLPT